MEEREEKRLRLLGGECFGEICTIELTERVGSHSRLHTLLWQKEGEEQPEGLSWAHRPVALVWSRQEEEPLFCGLITAIRFFLVGGRKAIRLEAMSYTCLLEEEKRRRSFQQETRTFGEMAAQVMAPYPGHFIWGGKGKEEKVNRFLFQYEETDWAFLSRVAALQEEPLVVEARYPGANVFIGLPPGRQPKPYAPLSYRLRKYLAKDPLREDNGEYIGVELLVEEEREDFRLGEPVLLENRAYVVWKKASRLTQGEWLHDYTLRPKSGCKAEA